ncbi:hypothetical protein SAMN05421770_101393 [Granulicella rosea]|uniref:Uncharacterized protein n=1 Tax=Granulicella rosea TaxID=474952 RepID=A0A239DBT1_9BACT|nr:hypothetical protein [Granulicella rosea]SNS29866.1 hypothetical protein SAMN05421770_101393 [Granulicella rosea]
MSPGDVRKFKRGSGNAVVIGHGLWASRQGKWIHIHLTGPDDSHTTVTNNPESVRFHRTLFRDLRRTLIKQGCWSFGEEGAETLDGAGHAPDPRYAHKDEAIAARYRPIQLRGEGLSASEIVLRDRERF